MTDEERKGREPKFHGDGHGPWFCRFLLHSCDPNLAIDTMVMEARVVKDIKPGGYLAIDYAATEDVLSSQFMCHCGAPNCRGWMIGRLEVPNEEGRRFLSGMSLSTPRSTAE